jgi:hypothetical protein
LQYWLHNFAGKKPDWTGLLITDLENALNLFHQHRDYFLQVGMRENFNIPKFHSLLHYVDSIKGFGTTNNYNTEMFE